MPKYVDYEYTPEYNYLQAGAEESKRDLRPASLVFIAEDGSRKHVIPGSAEAEMLLAQVKKNNPTPHLESETAEVSDETEQPDEAPADEQAEAPKKRGRPSKVKEG